MEAKGRKYIIHGSRSDIFTVWNLSDLHLMNKACDFNNIKADIEHIKNDPFSFWVGGGDYADYIHFKDKRFDPSCIPDFVKVRDMGNLGDVSRKLVKSLFGPIKHKCFGLLFGNHEEKYNIEKDQLDSHSWICKELGVDNLMYCSIFDVVFVRKSGIKKPILTTEAGGRNDHNGRKIYRFFVHHGAGFASTPGGKLNKLIQAMNSFDADVYFLGHVHDQTGRRQITIGANDVCTKLTQKVRLGVISGSYLKTYAEGITTYGEQRMYLPTTLGAAKVSINPDKDEIKAEV